MSDLYYDYNVQAWVEEGRYVNCGHPTDMKCGCYGRVHQGEKAVLPVGLSPESFPVEGISLVKITKRVLGIRDTDQPNGIVPEPAQGWSSIEGGNDARE